MGHLCQAGENWVASWPFCALQIVRNRRRFCGPRQWGRCAGGPHREPVEAPAHEATPEGPWRPLRRCTGYWQIGILKLAMRVLQLKVPLLLRYSVVNQNVQPSTGSTLMAL